MESEERKIMFKNVEKSKILLSMVVTILMVVLLGNIYSFATDNNTNNPVTITAATDNNTNTNNTNTNTNSNTNTNTNTNVANPANNVTTPIVSTSNNTANNVSVYNNTNAVSNSSNLPYTGNSSKTIVLVVVFAISAVYAYKKVSDYNV